jgi:hypothetical protein
MNKQTDNPGRLYLGDLNALVAGEDIETRNATMPVRQYRDDSLIRRMVDPPFSFQRPGGLI